MISYGYPGTAYRTWVISIDHYLNLEAISKKDKTAENPEMDKELKEILLQIRREVEKILPEPRRKTEGWQA